jgi:catabolite regulation protein CreA
MRSIPEKMPLFGVLILCMLFVGGLGLAGFLGHQRSSQSATAEASAQERPAYRAYSTGAFTIAAWKDPEQGVTCYLAYTHLGAIIGIDCVRTGTTYSDR